MIPSRLREMIREWSKTDRSRRDFPVCQTKSVKTDVMPVVNFIHSVVKRSGVGGEVASMEVRGAVNLPPSEEGKRAGGEQGR